MRPRWHGGVAFVIAMSVHLIAVSIWASARDPVVVEIAQTGHVISLQTFTSKPAVEETNETSSSSSKAVSTPVVPKSVQHIRQYKKPIQKKAIKASPKSANKAVEPVVNKSVSTAGYEDRQNKQVTASTGASASSISANSSLQEQARQSRLVSDYLTTVNSLLQKHKKYPSIATRRRQEGVVKLSFTVQMNGRVVSREIVSSSGFRSLDQAVLSMLEKASPLPSFPEDIKKDSLTLIVPVEFYLR